MKSLKYYIRKSHRYLGLFIGIQLLLWTIGGLYFSWTNIDKIHGDHLVTIKKQEFNFDKNLLSPNEALAKTNIKKNKIESIELKNVFDKLYYCIKNGNSYKLVDAQTGIMRKPLSKKEAADLAKNIFKPSNDIKNIEYVTKENIKNHLQYRGGVLPAWAIEFHHSSNSVIYLSAEKGTFEKIRNKQWRIFDFLWMLHIMDFKEREDINNYILRAFSIFSLLTVTSGFILFYQSSRTIRKVKKELNKKI